MITKKSERRTSILSKTSFVSGIIILIFLAFNSYFAIQLASNLAGNMIQVFSSKQKTALEKSRVRMKKALETDMKVNLEICTSVTRGFLYNFDQEELFKLLSSYLKLDGIVAIKVLDAQNKPFGAAWKAPAITMGETLPDTAQVDEKLSIVQDALQEGNKVGSVRIYYTDALVKESIKDREANTRENIQAFKTMAQKNIGTAIKRQIATAAVIILALIVTLVICLKIFVTRPINSTVAMIRDIAQGEGDLTRRLKIGSQDEIGALATWFNRFIENIQSLVREVSDNATTINQASTEFSALSESMNSQVGGLSDRSVTIAQAADNMSSNMTSVATAMEEASSNITMMATASEEMSSTINEIDQNAEKAKSITDNAVSQTQQAADEVKELGQAAETIGKVVETINDISEQVNLLALNATIEAARAGEAGKGFAVVANEIKGLANQTSEASGAIKEQILGIQKSSGKTVDAITNILGIVSEIDTIVATIATAVEEQSTATREISENIARTSAGIMEVNENIAQGSSASQEMAGNIGEIKESAGSLSSSSHNVKANADNLSELGDHLEGLMGKFKV
ncbi:methyl-accepting chemotaxis protein [Desulfobacter curvatus]|uniref:methyl-accepting chemotaxis protein n=1 Tax=Desulfobacter curvatus TaxID=2290 RepID=UPI00037CF54B|nr:methyl-accepting chemotaxis protein [Desulfobacter curvatus]